MGSLEQARETQLKNILAKTGKSLDQVRAIIKASKLTKHSELRELLSAKLDLGFGDANALVHFALASDGQSAAQASGAAVGDILDAIYTGQKAALRPIHEKVIGAASKLGPFEIAPKKGYVSLRRQKQFAMVGPGTKGRLEIGLNMKGPRPGPRLTAQPPGGMCQFKVFLTSAEEVDKELVAWLRTAYESAG
ncbi:MAG: DUF4287 domain-containing protein [Chloroflexi bacterium]|nr:DUF4287 domain-containing protein [Chloroflexota bacterium]